MAFFSPSIRLSRQPSQPLRWLNPGATSPAAASPAVTALRRSRSQRGSTAVILLGAGLVAIISALYIVGPQPTSNAYPLPAPHAAQR